MKIRNSIYLILILFSLSYCKDDESIGPVSVSTLGAELLEDGGVMLIGQLRNPNEISSHGINLYIDNGNVLIRQISLGKPLKSGRFIAEILSDLKKNEEYFFEAFILTTDNSLIKGELKRFTSNGNKPIEIDGILPSKVHLGDTITIKGRYLFSYHYVLVYFNDERAKIVNSNDSIITCIVPTTLKSSDITISINRREDKFVLDDQVQLYSPLVSSVGASSVNFRDVFEIFGDHFDIVDERNRVTIGNAEAIVVFSSRKLLKIVIPDHIDTSSMLLSVSAQLQTTTFQKSINLISPTIFEIPLKGYTQDEVLIKGTGFHPLYYKNKVYFGEAEASIIDCTINQLKVKVPNGPFPKRSTPIKVKILDLECVSKEEFTVEDAWLMITNTLPFSYYGGIGTFSIGKNAYVIAPSDQVSDQNNYLWIYNPETMSWEKELLPFSMSFTAACTGNGMKGYIYTATLTNNFWEYDPVTNIWTQKSSFPGNRRDKAAIFSVEDNIYIGIGSDFETSPRTDYLDFYRFDPQKNSWTQISNIGFDIYGGQARTEATTFVIDNEAYLVGGAHNTGDTDYWMYNPDSDIWKLMGDFFYSINYTSGFVLGGKGYLANGSFMGDAKISWVYNPLNNQWSESKNIGNFGRERGFAFVVAGKAYVGGGYSSWNENSTFELYQLDESRL